MTPKQIERGYEAQEEASNHVWTGQHDDNLWVWASALHGMYESFCGLFSQLIDPEP